MLCDLPTPALLEQKVSLQARLDRQKVVVLIFVHQKSLEKLHLLLFYPEQAAVRGGVASFLPHLEVAVKKHFLAQGPTEVDEAHVDCVDLVGVSCGMEGIEFPGELEEPK